ncbi:TIM21-domain-containing protein [Pelagophyceae sp. CCMP2097]|nr:TIM21-domain-containing protein [Pelagophyceae sp. CCMP2097]
MSFRGVLRLGAVRPVGGACVAARRGGWAHLQLTQCRSGVAASKRTLCVPPKGAEQKPAAAADDGSDETQLAPLTAGQKVQVGFNLSAWAAGLALALTCGYFIVRELFPSKLSPNAVFDTAFEVVRYHPEVSRLYGDPIKGYGRDHGGHREGRRNFIDNTAYDEPADGSKRMRVRFNIKGAYSEGFVFAEVSNKHDGFVYLMVQDKRTGRVVTLEDHRLMLTTTGAARSDAEREALSNLLGSKR